MTDENDNDVTTSCTYTNNPNVNGFYINQGNKRFLYTAPIGSEVGEHYTTTVTATYEGATATATVNINIVASE